MFYRILAAGIMAPNALVCVGLYSVPEKIVPHNGRHALCIRGVYVTAILVVGINKRLLLFCCEL